MNTILRLLLTAAICFVLAKVLPGVSVDTFWNAILFAFVLSLLNVFVKPVMIVLTFPVTIITLGLFLFVINALFVLLASILVDGFVVENFWWALLFALILSIINAIINNELGKRKKSWRKRRPRRSDEM